MLQSASHEVVFPASPRTAPAPPAHSARRHPHRRRGAGPEPTGRRRSCSLSFSFTFILSPPDVRRATANGTMNALSTAVRGAKLARGRGHVTTNVLLTGARSIRTGLIAEASSYAAPAAGGRPMSRATPSDWGGCPCFTHRFRHVRCRSGMRWRARTWRAASRSGPCST